MFSLNRRFNCQIHLYVLSSIYYLCKKLFFNLFWYFSLWYSALRKKIQQEPITRLWSELFNKRQPNELKHALIHHKKTVSLGDFFSQFSFFFLRFSSRFLCGLFCLRLFCNKLQNFCCEKRAIKVDECCKISNNMSRKKN